MFDNVDLSSFNNGLIYVPESYLNSNYNYYFNNNYIRIITNSNCYQNYNSTYCDCYDFNYANNVMSESISCNTSTNLSKINFNSLSSEPINSVLVRDYYFNQYFMYFFIIIFVVLFVSFLTKTRSGY